MFLDSSLIVLLDWILLLVMFLTFCQQMFSQRFNLYGITSLLSLSLYIAIHSLEDGLNMFVFILFIGGIMLILLEMFVPGGILGILGTITLIGSIIMVNESTHQISFIIIVSIAAFIVLYLLNIYFFKNKLLFLNRFILDEEISTEKGYVAKESELSLLGKQLVAFTDLRPAGIALLNDEKYDVVTEGEFINKGTNVVVTHVEGMRIVVRQK